jgi:hypothetical protein
MQRLKKGDKVKLIGIPPGVRDDKHLQTRTLFEKYLGRVFPVTEVEEAEDSPEPFARLEAGRVVGEKRYSHTIWVEGKYLELQRSSGSRSSSG